MSIVHLTKYAKVNLKQIEIRILTEAIKNFKPVYKDKESFFGHEPTQEALRDLESDLSVLNEYLGSTRFCNIKHPDYESWGDVIQCHFTTSDIIMIIEMLSNKEFNDSIEEKPKNEIENPTMYRIFKHHVKELLDDMIQIKKSMQVRRFGGFRFA